MEMAEAPTGDAPLTSDDAVNVLEEILDAQNQSYVFGRKLQLPEHVVDGIHVTYSRPRDRLLQVLIEFTKLVDPRPTWRGIVTALRNPVVNLPQLAMRVEGAHCPSTTSTTSYSYPIATCNAPLETAIPTLRASEILTSAETSSAPRSSEMDIEHSDALTVEAAHFTDSPAACDALLETGSESKTLTTPPAKRMKIDTRRLGILTRKPTLPELLQLSSGNAINIVEQIGTHYSKLGPLLLNDSMGAVTSAIVGEHHHNAEEINQKILTRWLQGQGKQPVCWSTLLDVLKDIGLLELTQTIQEGLSSSSETSSAQTSTSPSVAAVQSPMKYLQQMSGKMTIQYVQAKIRQFEKRFNALKKSTRECLEKLRIPVKGVADALTSLPADDVDDHKQFLESHLSALYQAPDHSELFGTMNFHWNYQNYQLLDHLIQEFNLEAVKGEMNTYKEDLQLFRKKTPLMLFCQSQRKKRVKPPPDFNEVVAEFDWPDDVTLEVVEEFRQEYAYQYNLHECAMMLAVVLPHGSFIITWFVPSSIVEKLKVKLPNSILKKYSITKLEIAGECAYPKVMNKMSSATQLSGCGPSSPATGKDTAGNLRRMSVQPLEGRDASQPLLAEQDFLFVEQPSKNFFCPVTYGLLLQPHLTPCCGNHISQEAAMRIQGETTIWLQGEGGACPLCNMPDFVTLPDKCFLRQVKKLHVFCHHKERGCMWQGELFDLDHHLQSCPYSDLPGFSGEKTSGAWQERTRHQVFSYAESAPIPSSERISSQQPLSAKRDLSFVEQPSDDFYCPVTHGLMFHPHLTACCGRHLSQEAATWIQEKGMRCPMCNNLYLMTVLDEWFHRQVNKLHVFCCHEDRGCGWQGELSDLERHVQSCPMKTAPLLSDLLKLPLYSDGDVTSATGQYRTRYLNRVLQNTNSACQQQSASYICYVSGPGLQSATTNHPTHVIVELTDSSNRCSVPQKVTAQLKLISKASSSRKSLTVHVAVATTSPSQYEVSYTAICQGEHKLHVQLNDIEINGSPFTINVYPDPTQLAHPVRLVTGLEYPHGIAFNTCGEMVVSEQDGCQIAVFNTRGQRIRTFGSYGDSSEQMKYPRGVAIDDMENIYVSSDHKLQKFTSSGELIKCVGQLGSKEGEFNVPHGVALYNSQLYVCDRNNHRIQVFDLDLNFIHSIGSHGKGRGEFNAPCDVKFDTAGHMHIAEFDNYRVQVTDKNGHFIRMFGEKGMCTCRPSGLHIVDKYIYVSDYSGDCIAVYETSGQFVTSLGGRGPNKGKFWVPYGITSCADGYIYVCDYLNNRVQIF